LKYPFSGVVQKYPKSFDFSGKAIVLETLKKRRRGVYRAVPVPAGVLDTLNMVHGLTEAGKRQGGPKGKPPCGAGHGPRRFGG
jgi:hypothetical protein